MKIKYLSFLVLSLFVNQAGHSQDSIKTKPSFTYSLFAYYGFALSRPEQNSTNSFPRGLTAVINWHRTDQEIFNQYGCFPRQSLSIAFFDFDNSVYGRGINLAYSLEPHLMPNKHLSFYPRISIGAISLSNPFSSANNPTNKAYSLPVSAYLALGIGMRWQLSSQWGFQLTSQLHHASNGGWHEPNNGLNWTTVALGLDYSPRGLEFKRLKRIREKNDAYRLLRMDVEIFGLVRGGNILGVDESGSVLGFNFTTSKQMNRLHAWTAAFELYQDKFLQKQQTSNLVSSDGMRAGILAGHEFLLGKFIFSQQVGVYLTGRYDADLFYHRWGLQYYLLPRWRIGVNLRAYRQVAEFTDIRVAYLIWEK
jgi:hypothetical protein